MAISVFLGIFRGPQHFEKKISQIYNCSGAKDFYLQFYLFLNNFSKKSHILETESHLLSAVIVLLTNFISKPYSNKMFNVFRRSVLKELKERGRLQVNGTPIGFKKFIRLLKRDLRNFEKYFYCLVHNENPIFAVLNPLEFKCNAISYNANRFQSYSLASSRYLSLENMVHQNSALVHLPHLALKTILNSLNGPQKMNLMLTCKTLYSLCSPLAGLDYTMTDFLQQSSDGVCLHYKMSRHRCMVDNALDFCKCSICFSHCPCDYSSYQDFTQLRNLTLRNCKINRFVINSPEEIDLLSTLRFVPRSIEVNITLTYYSLSVLLSSSKLPWLDKLKYTVDEDTFEVTKHMVNRFNPIPVRSLHIKYLSRRKKQIKTSKILTYVLGSHIKSCSEIKMKDLKLTNCRFLESFFVFIQPFGKLFSYSMNWASHLETLDLSQCEIKCTYFANLEK